jgi:hypothetical protein
MSPSCPYPNILPQYRPLSNYGILAGICGLSTIKPPNGPSKTVYCSSPHSSFIASGSQRATWPVS